MPHILELCPFSIPEMWNFDSLLKQKRFKNPGFESSQSSILTTKCFRRGLSSGLGACSKCTLYA